MLSWTFTVVTIVTIKLLRMFDYPLAQGLLDIKEKLVVAVLGYEINLVERTTRGQSRDFRYTEFHL